MKKAKAGLKAAKGPGVVKKTASAVGGAAKKVAKKAGGAVAKAAGAEPKKAPNTSF